jgi:hypothetical protein
MAKGPLGFHGGEKKDPAVVDSWERNSPGKEITYTIRTVPSKMAHIYHCQIIQKMQGRSATEKIIGGKPLSRAEVEKLPKFVKLLAGSLPL